MVFLTSSVPSARGGNTLMRALMGEGPTQVGTLA
jgi:hypothetical protein